MDFIDSVRQLEERLARPSLQDIEVMRRLRGDIAILGAGGKMGPSLARRVKRASDAAGVARRVIAASRFSDPQIATELQRTGIETFRCDLLRRDEVSPLPLCENVLFLPGRKFGSTDRPDLTWAINTVVPANVATHFRDSRMVVFSTGNVYPLVTTGGKGSVETDDPGPVGEYAQSCLARERVFEFYAHEQGTRCLLFRLNYAIDLRYGVLVDIARKVHAGEPIDLTVSWFNTVWQGDADSYALRGLELCDSPPRILNVTGPEKISVRKVAQFFGRAFGCEPVLMGNDCGRALLSDASLCERLLGPPEIDLDTLLHWVAHWVEIGAPTLGKPTRFEVADGRF